MPTHKLVSLPVDAEGKPELDEDAVAVFADRLDAAMVWTGSEWVMDEPKLTAVRDGIREYLAALPTPEKP